MFYHGWRKLIGAKQNRITNSSFLIAPHSSTIIPVSCVEQNRWNYNTRNFSASDNIIFNKGRKEKFKIFIAIEDTKQIKVKFGVILVTR